MKIRQSFVTNSSSSSYVVSYKVLPVDLPELLESVKENFGNKGLTRLFEDVCFENDHIIFKSGKEVDIDDIFYDVSEKLYSKDGKTEYW